MISEFVQCQKYTPKLSLILTIQHFRVYMIKINNSIKFDSALVISSLIALKFLIVLVGIPIIVATFPDGWNTGNWPDQYDKIAINLINDNGYRIYPEGAETLQRMPGYPLLLAVLFTLFKKSITVVQFFNVIFSSLAAFIVMRMTFLITQSSKASYLAVIIALFYPGIIVADGRGGLESLYTLFITLTFIILFKSVNDKKLVNYIYLGIVLGFTLLIKSTLILLPSVTLIYLIYRRSDISGLIFASKAFSLTVIFMLLILSPWIVRNYQLTSKFIPMTTLSGVAAFQGLHLNKNITSNNNSKDILADTVNEQRRIAKELNLKFIPESFFFQVFYNTNDEIVFNDYLAKKSTEMYLSSPELIIKGVIGNSLGFWFLGKTKKSTFINFLLVFPFLVLSVYGAVVSIKRNYAVVPLILICLALYAPHVMIIGVSRYHIPLVPLLGILVSIGILSLKNSIYEKYFKYNNKELFLKG